jgi:bifunctional non-homologous end joining protein LigD
VTAVPKGETWVHEAKWDGYRFQILKVGAEVRLFSRSGADWTKRLPGLAGTFSVLPVRSAQLDGELCLCDERGRPDFYRLHGELRTRLPDESLLSFHSFDLLYLDGLDLKPLPLSQRRKHLIELHDRSEVPQFYLPDAFDNGGTLLAMCEKMGLEGVVSKKLTRPYTPGPSKDWVKVKCQVWKALNSERHKLFGKT